MNSVILFQCDDVNKDDVQKIVNTVKRALKVYGTPAFEEIIQNCMAQDLSWKVRLKSSYGSILLSASNDSYSWLPLWQGPAKEWEKFLLSLGVEGSEAGIDGEEVAPLAMENVATPWNSSSCVFHNKKFVK